MAQANVVSTKTAYEDQLKVMREDVEAVSKLKVVEDEANYSAAKATLQQSQAKCH